MMPLRVPWLCDPASLRVCLCPDRPDRLLFVSVTVDIGYMVTLT